MIARCGRAWDMVQYCSKSRNKLIILEVNALSDVVQNLTVPLATDPEEVQNTVVYLLIQMSVTVHCTLRQRTLSIN